MKDLPAAERPYEKCMEHGAGILSDAELLAVILRSGSAQYNSVDLARQVLLLAGEDGSLKNLKNMAAASFTGIKGIGKVKAIQLECIGELCRRMSQPDRQEKIRMSDAESIARYYMSAMGDLTQEELRVVLLDVKNCMIRDLMLTKGTVDSSLASTRDIFIQALKFGAVRVILVHNHPSGDPTPSRADIAVTKKAIEAGNLLDIMVLDHIIVGKDRYFSMRSSDTFCDYFA